MNSTLFSSNLITQTINTWHNAISIIMEISSVWNTWSKTVSVSVGKKVCEYSEHLRG